MPQTPPERIEHREPARSSKTNNDFQQSLFSVSARSSLNIPIQSNIPSYRAQDNPSDKIFRSPILSPEEDIAIIGQVQLHFAKEPHMSKPPVDFTNPELDSRGFSATPATRPQKPDKQNRKANLQTFLAIIGFVAIVIIRALIHPSPGTRPVNYTSMTFSALQQKSDHGDLHARVALAVRYIDGKGVPQNFEKAEQLLRKPARDNIPYARLNLGISLYLQGKKEEGIDWIKRAVSAGTPDAKEILQEIEQAEATRYPSN